MSERTLIHETPSNVSEEMPKPAGTDRKQLEPGGTQMTPASQHIFLHRIMRECPLNSPRPGDSASDARGLAHYETRHYETGHDETGHDETGHDETGASGRRARRQCTRGPSPTFVEASVDAPMVIKSYAIRISLRKAGSRDYFEEPTSTTETSWHLRPEWLRSPRRSCI